MAVVVSTTKPVSGLNGLSQSYVWSIGSVDVGSVEADLFVKQSGHSAERVAITIKNGSDTDMTVKIFTSDEPTPNGTHAQAEWDQEPDTSTSYTVGSAFLTTDRLKKVLVGPFRYWKIRGNHTSATSTGSVTVLANFLY